MTKRDELAKRLQDVNYSLSTVAAVLTNNSVCYGEIARLHTELASIAAALTAQTAEPVAFQQRVQPWMLTCFGAAIASDVVERNRRFIEESLELVQSTGCTVNEAHQLVDYVFSRPIGEKQQEVGGVMVTLAALCLASGMDMHNCGETELQRIWGCVEKIRAKQAAKPKHSPLPAYTAPQPGVREGMQITVASGQLKAWLEPQISGIDSSELRPFLCATTEKTGSFTNVMAVIEGMLLALNGENVHITITRAAEQINAEGQESGKPVKATDNPATGGIRSPAPSAPDTVVVPQWMEEELKDGDRICAELGLERTEGGRLPMYKLLAKLRELKK